MDVGSFWGREEMQLVRVVMSMKCGIALHPSFKLWVHNCSSFKPQCMYYLNVTYLGCSLMMHFLLNI